MSQQSTGKLQMVLEWIQVSTVKFCENPPTFQVFLQVAKLKLKLCSATYRVQYLFIINANNIYWRAFVIDYLNFLKKFVHPQNGSRAPFRSWFSSFRAFFSLLPMKIKWKIPVFLSSFLVLRWEIPLSLFDLPLSGAKLG